MIIKNPTDNKIEMVYLGTPYEIEAKSELVGVPAEVAFHWKKRVHQFVEVFEDVKKVAKEIADVKKEVVDVAEAVVETVEDVKKIMKKPTKK